MKKIYSTISMIALLAALFPVAPVFAAESCPFTANANNYVFHLDRTAVFANQAPRQVTTAVTNVPRGRFEVAVATFDNHSNQNDNARRQQNEIVKLFFKNGQTVVDSTRATQDIGNNTNIRVSNVGRVTLHDAVNRIQAQHAAARPADNNEGVRVLCVRLRPVYLIHDDLEVSCSPSEDTVARNENVTWTAAITGGATNATYSYVWGSGETSQTATTSHNFIGTYTQGVVVSDGHNTATAQCSVGITADGDDDDDDDLDLRCRVSDTTIREGDVVEYEVEIDGGNSPYDIEWDGDISGDDDTERVRYNREGRYEVDVTVTDDDGERETVSCPDVRVREDNDDDDDDNIRVISGNYRGSNTTGYGNYTGGTNVNNTGYYPYGQYANAGSVYLSQIPYTGPADVAKVIGFIVLGLALASGTYIAIRKRKFTATAIASRVTAFKESNKLADQIS